MAESKLITLAIIGAGQRGTVGHLIGTLRLAGCVGADRGG
jgi:hypothetical protein